MEMICPKAKECKTDCDRKIPFGVREGELILIKDGCPPLIEYKPEPGIKRRPIENHDCRFNDLWY